MAIKTILTGQEVSGGGGGSVEVTKLEIKTPPARTSYLAGDNFDTTGMVVEATYSLVGVELKKAVVSNASLLITPTPLVDNINEVSISYSELGCVVSAKQQVQITHRVTKLEITANPSKIIYEYGDTFSTAGMQVTATYSDGQTANIISYSCSPMTLNEVTSNQIITVSYQENGVTVETELAVAVERKTLANIPSQSGILTYTGSALIPSWNDYDSAELDISGTTSATNANTYTASFTPTANYRWSDKTVGSKEVNWEIKKATASFDLSTTTVEINGDNASTGVTVQVNNKKGGTVSASSNNTAITVSVNNTTLTIKGDGQTAAIATITVYVDGNDNYNKSSNKTITVTASYFKQGDFENSSVSWSTIHSIISNKANSGKLSNYFAVGQTRDLTLTSSFLGVNQGTSHKIRIIGIEQDAPNTITIQTVDMFPTLIQFDPSDARWWKSNTSFSNARTQCINYYNALPTDLKNIVATVKKGTCSTQNNSRQASMPSSDYHDENVFLLSELECGLDSYSPIAKAYSTATQAENTYGVAIDNSIYQYYNAGSESQTRRIKQQNNSGTMRNYHWWLRSRYYLTSDSNGVCYVSSGGNADYNSYNNSRGLAPALTVQ